MLLPIVFFKACFISNPDAFNLVMSVIDKLATDIQSTAEIDVTTIDLTATEKHPHKCNTPLLLTKRRKMRAK